MMTKFKSVSAQTPKLVGKTLAKVKGGGGATDHTTEECQLRDTSSHHCVPQLRDISSHHCAIPQ